MDAPGDLTVSPDVRASLHDDGVVFLQLRSGAVFRSNRIGAAIWKGLLDREDPAAVALRISRECSVPAEQVSQDAAQFLSQLEANGFLVRGLEA